MNEVLVFEDVISKEHEDAIEECLGGKKFDWHYQKGATHSDDGSDDIYGFTKVIYFAFDKLVPDPTYMQLLVPLLKNAVAKMDPNAEIKQVYRIRVGLFTKNQNDGKSHLPHIDFTHEHHTMIYYVNDCDGPTSLFDDEGNITYECHPKKGRCLIFPGKTMHSSSEPTMHPHRIAITFNFLI